MIMAVAADLNPVTSKKERVLEVGPGQGILTSALLASGARVIAIEKDDRLITGLRERFKNELADKKLEIRPGDILDFDPAALGGPYKIVANLPYYLTGEFLKKFLTAKYQPRSMVLMIQKEVAERIIAKAGKESILSLSVKAYGQPRYIQTVTRGNFYPAPKIDSSLIAIENISKNNFVSDNLEQKFFNLVRRGFASKRKKLKNNLILTGPSLIKYGDRRAEDLKLAEWFDLCRN